MTDSTSTTATPLENLKQKVKDARKRIWDQRTSMTGKEGGYIGTPDPSIEKTGDAFAPLQNMRNRVQAKTGTVGARMISEYKRDAAPEQSSVPATRARLISA